MADDPPSAQSAPDIINSRSSSDQSPKRQQQGPGVGAREPNVGLMSPGQWVPPNNTVTVHTHRPPDAPRLEPLQSTRNVHPPFLLGHGRQGSGWGEDNIAFPYASVAGGAGGAGSELGAGFGYGVGFGDRGGYGRGSTVASSPRFTRSESPQEIDWARHSSSRSVRPGEYRREIANSAFASSQRSIVEEGTGEATRRTLLKHFQNQASTRSRWHAARAKRYKFMSIFIDVFVVSFNAFAASSIMFNYGRVGPTAANLQLASAICSTAAAIIHTISTAVLQLKAQNLQSKSQSAAYSDLARDIAVDFAKTNLGIGELDALLSEMHSRLSLLEAQDPFVQVSANSPRSST